MSTSIHWRGLRASSSVVALLVLSFACTEPQHADHSKPSPTAAFDARIELSDSLPKPGDDIVVTARLVGAQIASATARLLYDTTGVELVREEAFEDGTTRVMNPVAGALRVAAVAANGLPDGRFYAWRFTVRRTAALRSFHLTIDEAHTISRADAAASLSRKP
jgi:hypothetical protein